jgi:hypothetical protein
MSPSSSSLLAWTQAPLHTIHLHAHLQMLPHSHLIPLSFLTRLLLYCAPDFGFVVNIDSIMAQAFSKKFFCLTQKSIFVNLGHNMSKW